MMNKQVELLLILSGFVLLTSCYNLRKDPYEGPKKITWWDSFQTCVFRAHDCRRFPTQCRPICRQDLEQFSKNEDEERAKWIAFKEMAPYTPHETGIRLLDDANIILARISNQIRDEIVIPYRDMAEKGHLQAYKEFRADVYYETSVGLDHHTAVTRVYKYWLIRYGEEQCRQLLAAIPCIEQMRADRQLVEVLMRNKTEILSVVGNTKKGVQQLKDSPQNSRDIIDVVDAGCQTLVIADQLFAAIDYLADFCAEEGRQDAELRFALQDIQRHNNNQD